MKIYLENCYRNTLDLSYVRFFPDNNYPIYGRYQIKNIALFGSYTVYIYIYSVKFSGGGGGGGGGGNIFLDFNNQSYSWKNA